MHKIVVLFVLFTVSNSAFCQGKIDYGNNKTASKYYKIRGVNIYTEQYGSGKPLLLIHGNGGRISSMASIIPYFSLQYKVIAVDSRAQGKSTDNTDSLSFEMMADDEAELLPSASWIDTTENFNQNIKYQQTLFDLSEIYVRKFRKNCVKTEKRY